MIIALLISLFLLLGTSLMGQNPPIALPADGDWPTVVDDSIMLIGPKQEALTEEQRYFNPPYLLVYPGKEHLKNDMIRAALCDCDPTQPNRRIGVFSVAPDKQVSFSQGNLQYLPAANIWKFADTQYEYLGNANKYLTPTFRNWVDLFGWSANNTTAPFGVSISTNVANYAGAFVDWGTNTICGDAPNTWRTLSANEWKYLFEQRKNALQLRSKGSVNGHRGHILLPDDWVLPEGVQFVAEPDNLTMELEINTYTPAEWSIMEEAGAVFLPAAGRRDGTTVGYLVEYSGVWSSTSTTNTNAFHTYYNYESQIIEHHWTSATSRINGRSVRLVHDTIVPIPEYVDLGLSVKWATFNVGASKPEDYGDYFAWGETEPKETYSWATYKWGTSSNLTKYNTTDGKTILDPEDDAAHVNWGSKWRMPSKEEVDELTQQCSWIWTTHNNVNGYKVTGPNGNSIFLPAAGYKGGGPTYPAGEDGLYWTNTTEKQHYSYLIVLHDDAPPTQAGRQGTRCFGFTIRPVYDDRPPKRIGVFSVAADKQVSFSQGNLQYTQSTDEWQFAREQYEYIGAANIKDGALADRIDMFGWSANNTTAPFGVSTSTNDADYTGDFVDWGTKLIQGDAKDTWRTLSIEEWEYIYHGRKNADQLLAIATLEGVPGLILLPDNWQQPEDIPFVSSVEQGLAWDATRVEGSYFDASNKDHTKDNIYIQAQWQKMEALGAVFLPCAGWRQEKTWTHAGIVEVNIKYLGSYWSCSTPQISNDYYFFRFTQQEIRKFPLNNSLSLLARGRSVRLVHDTIVPTPEYVDLGLSVKWATFNVGATSPEDYGDYFAWGETEPKETYSWANYKWCEGTSTNMTKYNAEDGKTILEPADDAAHVNWGGNWRMPTEEEQQELIDRCSWERITLNGVIGYKVTGPNGNSIFIPIAGAYNSFDNQLNSVGSIGWIYSSTIATEIRAYEIHIEEGGIQQRNCSRCVGLTIRPVYDDRPPKRIGVFSVGADKQVSFSQGNLQYIQSTDTWQFAANQLEYMGHKHYRNEQLADTIEYFGWSGKNSKTPWGISLSTESSDYAGEFLDWGTNSIAGSAPNTWRTLSNEEWLYICQGRKNADQLLGLGTIGTVTGLIILPDDWQLPAGLSFTPNTDNATKNQYTYNQWAVMENAGAVFLPPTGYFNHKLTNMRGVNELGYYRSSTLADDGRQIYMLYANSRIRYSLSGKNDGNLYYAFSVRLVHDTVVPIPEYVDLGLSVKWATFNVGATSPNEIGNFYAWGEIEPKDTYTVHNYQWWNKSSKEITKYCTIDSLAYGDVADGLTELQPQDDIAHFLKGEHWRMPNLDECKELGNGCTWTVSTRQGQIGFEGTSKINGNTIFLPVVGFRAGANLVHETLGGYWSSTLNIEKQSCAMGLYLNRETPSVGIYYNSSRQNGFLIRPVYDDRP